MSHVHATVEHGELRGVRIAGADRFLGIPYGADTSGENRFRAPQPVEAWEGVRDALVFGPSAPQPDLRLSAPALLGPVLSLLMPRGASPVESGAISEDCLRVNVWTPSDRDGRSLPVLVWFHGGGFGFGSGNEMSFNGDLLATAADMVVVTVTHRLGLLGFLDLRAQGEAGSANAGMLDIVAALEWVQRNIAAFGGDPARVTVCGQSGGSGKVAALTAMPKARELFSRAIMMSGPFGKPARPESSAAVAERALADAGVDTVADLRRLPLERLLAVQAGLRTQGFFPNRDEKPDFAAVTGFGPCLDPVDLPGDAFGDEASEGLRGKELLVGWTSHEATFLLSAEPDFTADLTAARAAERVDALAHIDGVTYADLAARHPHEAPHLLLGRRMSWLTFIGPSRDVADLASAKAAGVWAYEFQQPTEVLDGLLGACHSLELAYVFGTVGRIPLTGRGLQRHAVSRDMMRAWARFVHDGDPGWRHWGAERVVQAFGSPIGEGAELPEDVDMAAPLR
ncbi:carboxylesterase family protein [Microbacterium sp. NPDC089320]|uniref:carboxylesterase/lipase family protein n=1 Tax=Microbacterium sp. NPDC089320 TaxID=3155182 RepID=UPI0034229069